MQTEDNKKAYERRIISIVKSHILIFGTDELSLNLGSFLEAQDLLSFNSNSPRHILKRVLSILRANHLMLEEELLVKKKERFEEFSKLETYLLSLLEVAKRDLAHTNIVPQTLGLSFLRKGFGLPLFGYHRPKNIPKIQGLLLCYQSMAADGVGRIDFLLLDSSSKMHYKDLGIEINSNCDSLHCVIADQTELSFPGTLIPKAAFTGNKTSQFNFDTRVAVLSEKKKKYRIKNKIFNPLYYQYPYFFIADDFLSSNLTRFLLDLFLGSFSFREREVEPLVLEIIQRVL